MQADVHLQAHVLVRCQTLIFNLVCSYFVLRRYNKLFVINILGLYYVMLLLNICICSFQVLKNYMESAPSKVP